MSLPRKIRGGMQLTISPPNVNMENGARRHVSQCHLACTTFPDPEKSFPQDRPCVPELGYKIR